MNATDEWYDVTEPAAGVWTITEGGMFGSQLVAGEDRALLVDAGAGVGDLRGMVDQLVDVPVTLLVTHGHWDHVGNANQFDDVIAHPLAHDDGAIPIEPLSLHPADWAENWRADGGAFPDGFDPANFEIPPAAGVRTVYPGTVLDLGGRELTVLATPGHAADHLSVLDRDAGLAFVSDVVHTDYDLYAHFPGGDVRAYLATLELLVDLAAAGAYETIFFSHVPPLSGAERSLLRDYRDGLRDIIAGDRPAESVEGAHPARRYDVAGNHVLTAQDRD